MLTTIRYILITALRDKLFAGLFVAVSIAFGISVFLGGTAAVEQEQMMVSYIAGATRVILLIGLIVFVCFHVRTAFNNKEIELILSRPISRLSFVIAYWMGFATISLFLIIPLTVAIPLFLHADTAGLLYWGGSLVLEAWLVVAFALFASLILQSAVSSVLLCFGFYFISRMMGFFLYIIDKPQIFQNVDVSIYMAKALAFISAILPRLDMFGKSKWLIYGIVEDTSFLWFIPQTAIYIPLILAMAVADLKRKQF